MVDGAMRWRRRYSKLWMREPASSHKVHHTFPTQATAVVRIIRPFKRCISIRWVTLLGLLISAVQCRQDFWRVCRMGSYQLLRSRPSYPSKTGHPTFGNATSRAIRRLHGQSVRSQQELAETRTCMISDFKLAYQIPTNFFPSLCFTLSCLHVAGQSTSTTHLPRARAFNATIDHIIILQAAD